MRDQRPSSSGSGGGRAPSLLSGGLNLLAPACLSAREGGKLGGKYQETVGHWDGAESGEQGLVLAVHVHLGCVCRPRSGSLDFEDTQELP